MKKLTHEQTDRIVAILLYAGIFGAAILIAFLTA